MKTDMPVCFKDKIQAAILRWLTAVMTVCCLAAVTLPVSAAADFPEVLAQAKKGVV